jgi:hypothetical protein
LQQSSRVVQRSSMPEHSRGVPQPEWVQKKLQQSVPLVHYENSGGRASKGCRGVSRPFTERANASAQRERERANASASAPTRARQRERAARPPRVPAARRATFAA